MNSTFARPDFAGPDAALGAGVPYPGEQRLQRAAGSAGAWIRQRLDRVLSRPTPPLQLELTQRFVRFRGLREFEFALASRVDFPAQRMRELMALTPSGAGGPRGAHPRYRATLRRGADPFNERAGADRRVLPRARAQALLPGPRLARDHGRPGAPEPRVRRLQAPGAGEVHAVPALTPEHHSQRVRVQDPGRRRRLPARHSCLPGRALAHTRQGGLPAHRRCQR